MASMEAEALRQGSELHPEREGFEALDRMQADLDDVARALERLDEGTYGTCQTCGGPIPDELLATQPATRHCPTCLSAR